MLRRWHREHQANTVALRPAPPPPPIACGLGASWELTETIKEGKRYLGTVRLEDWRVGSTVTLDFGAEHEVPSPESRPQSSRRDLAEIPNAESHRYGSTPLITPHLRPLPSSRQRRMRQ